MSDTILHCPNCGHAIALREALATRIRGEVESDLAAEQARQLAQAVDHARREASAPLHHELASLRQELEMRERVASAASQRELEMKRRTVELEQGQRDLEERLRLEIEAQLRADADVRARTLAAQAARQAGEAAAQELAQTRAALQAQRAELDAAQAKELALRQQAEELQQRQRSIDLELARRVDAKRSEWEQQWRQLQDQEQALRLREKERQIEELRQVIGELRRKSEQGSQERQGETLERDIEAALAARFPRDRLCPVAKGTQGADLIQEVRDASLAACGSIVWEFKSTRNWQPAWLAKLRDDQRACGASVAVLVSAALPDAAQNGFALVEGVWVCSLAAWPALATALREQLLQVAHARNAATGMNEKMEALYRYLSGDRFRHKVEAIVEAFTAMQDQLARERRAMEKLWKERERQLERVVGSTAGMYGELRGTIGAAMTPIAALELDVDVAPDAAALPGPTR